MPSFLDVAGTIAAKAAIIVVVVLVAGLVLAFTSISVVGYILLAAAAVLYVLFSIRSVS